MDLPEVIQGGMGVGVSGWRLARAVAAAGELGVVSGTALEVQLARRLQLGDEGGHLRRSLARFPDPAVAGGALARYFVPGGLRADQPFKTTRRHTVAARQDLVELTVLASFVEVDLAREGHDGRVGINLLEKIRLPTLPTLYGALLAGVDTVIMGAGIPLEIPGALDRLAAHQPASLAVAIAGDEPGSEMRTRFDPATVVQGLAPLVRPRFLAIISAVSLAQVLVRRANGRVDGFIVEAPTAGGHNAPPRGAPSFDELGQPVYGPRDEVDLDKLRALGLPFWLAGGRGGPGELDAARALGAAGIQVGTAFAFCRESGLEPELRRRAIDAVMAGSAEVLTDPLASPTGFPFKVVQLAGTLSEPELYAGRERICNLGYLAETYRRPDGGIGFRCAAEPVEKYVAKGGDEADALGRKCLCNALVANLGLGGGERGGAGAERPLLTAGDDLASVARCVVEGGVDYAAADVLRVLRASGRRRAIA
jgi:NAD(P)H-dependent flavin oxidoreductase YrpB (nitropropane dioxygenase family)